jgi:MoaA/NifB/PqqE/SkfB family radical SAM enzyme
MIKFHELERIHIELSTACNAACPACPRNAEGGYTIPWLKTRTMSFTDYTKIFTKTVCEQLNDILMCGNFGDPAYCKDLPEILKYTEAMNSNINVAIHTNGGVRPPEWWADLAKSYKNLHIVFSIDGLEDTNHIYRRNVNWHRLIENATAFINAGGVAIWEFLIFRHNQHQLDESRNLAAELNFSEIKFKRPFGFESVTGSYSSMRVLDESGNLDYFIYPAEDENFRNRNFSDIDVERYLGNVSLPVTAYKTALDYKTNNFDSIFEGEALHYKDLDDNEISCMTKNHKEIYIDSNGHVHPCCFLGIGSQNVNLAFDIIQYNTWLRRNLEKDQVNAKVHPLEDIINSDFLKKIEDTWKKKHSEGRMMCCTKMCSKEKSAKDKLYIQSKVNHG